MTRSSRRASWPPGAERDRGLISMVMVVTMVGLGLGALIIPIIVAQTRSTLHIDTRVQALHAAETGLEGMLGRIRAATADGGVSGLASGLPCYSATPLVAAISGSTTTSYSATLAYYASDPSALVGAAAPVALGCTAGLGTFDVLTAAPVVPSFARITSVGTDNAGGQNSSRTLYTTYSFNTTNSTTVGGQIRVYSLSASDPALCMDPGPAPSVAGLLTAVACTKPVTAAQKFVYNADLSLSLVSSSTSTRRYGLCLSTDTTTLTLQPCAAPGAAPYTEQWSLNDAGEFVGLKADLSRQSFCLTADASLIRQLVVGPCQGGLDANAASSWVPVPSVGAGAAGAANNQLMNFSQFDRCAYATDQTAPTAAGSFMILYPCTQDTRAAKVDWSQKFTYVGASQHWVTTTNSVDYCLTSPGVAGGYVTLTRCDTTNTTPTQVWTELGVTAADQATASKWSYATRYTIVDNSSTKLCLSLSPISGVDGSGASTADWYVPSGTHRQYSKITVNTCDGSAMQKWNAFPQPSSLQNTKEKK